MSYGQRHRSRRKYASGLRLRLFLAGGILLFSAVSYFGSSDKYPISGKTQQAALTGKQEIHLGRSTRLEMAKRHGGLHPSRDAQQMVDEIGLRLVDALDRQFAEQGRANPYPFEFHLLADQRTINAFALPGGQVFITYGLYDRLQTTGQLAAVLGHEMGHILERHVAKRLANQKTTRSLIGTPGVFRQDSGSKQAAQMVGQLVNMKFGPNDELESDRWAVQLMVTAGFDPRAMLAVMDILDSAVAAGSQPEMLSTHPLPADRQSYIQERIAEFFPNGLPPGLKD